MAIASGDDGVDLVRKLGADQAVNGRNPNVVGAVKVFAPNGLDAVLAFAYQDGLKDALKQVKKTGRIAYPNGVDPEPVGLAGVEVSAYDGLPSPEVFDRLNSLIAQGPFHVEISRTYRLEEAAQAHQDVLKHHLGKLALRIAD